MRELSDRVAVITGAAGGIGRSLSELLARQGCHVALVDIDEAGLKATVELLHSARDVSMHVTDVGNWSEMKHLTEAVVSRHRGVHLLVNNAGASLSGPFESYGIEDIDWIVRVNFLATVYGCRLFLPHLRARQEAHIVNVSSLFGLIGCPTKTVYCAAKFAVRGFSDALRAELSGSKIGVTCVYPGAVRTGLVRNSRGTDPRKREIEAEFLDRRGISPQSAAKRILRGIQGNARCVRIGRDVYAADILSRAFPGLTSALVARLRKRVPFF